MTDSSDRRVTVGRIVGLFGVRGWVKVYSHTRPPEAILNYRPWLIERAGVWREIDIAEARPHGKGIVARLDEYTDRDQAAVVVGAEIAVRMAQLPPAGKHEYYWAQLEGLRVVTLEGHELGRVSHLFETGANDVMAVAGERERLIPFSKNYIQKVDLTAGQITVDWDPAD